MERSRSRLDPIQYLRARDRQIEKRVSIALNNDRSFPDWLELNTAGAPALVNGWVQYASNDATYAHSAIFVNMAGVVMCRGLISGGTIGAAAFTFPQGLRPKRSIVMPTVAADLFGSIRVHADGTFVPHSGSNAWFSIACQFRAEQ